MYLGYRMKNAQMY